MGIRMVVRKTITSKEAEGFGLKGKPKCPWCDKPLIFICGDVVGGHINQKCGKCGKLSLIDMKTMEAIAIEQETALAH